VDIVDMGRSHSEQIRWVHCDIEKTKAVRLAAEESGLPNEMAPPEVSFVGELDQAGGSPEYPGFETDLVHKRWETGRIRPDGMGLVVSRHM
jgi:hypothetical protein